MTFIFVLMYLTYRIKVTYAAETRKLNLFQLFCVYLYLYFIRVKTFFSYVFKFYFILCNSTYILPDFHY